MTQTKLRVMQLNTNRNISFPVGTALAVRKYSEKLDFENIFSRYKKRGIRIIGLIEAMITYRLTENQSISRASEWINRQEVLELFELSAFEERTLFRALKLIRQEFLLLTYPHVERLPLF